MAKTYEELLEQAAIIRDETAAGKNTATRVGGTITDAVDYVKNLQDTYAGIHAEASEAKTEAAAAKSTASEAKMNATAAMNTARSASLNATAASGTANEASSTANAAKESADAAKATAAAANGMANEAKTESAQAVSTAQEAKTAAQEAKTAADNANNLATEAQTTATAAQTIAQEAKETAEDAKKIKEYKLLHSHTFPEDATSSDYELLTADDGTPIHQYKDILIFAFLSYVEGGSTMIIYLNKEKDPRGRVTNIANRDFATAYIFKLKIDGLNTTLYSESHTNSFFNGQYTDGNQGVNLIGITPDKVFTYDRLTINFPFKANNKILIYGR